jgi:hypothetical protein
LIPWFGGYDLRVVVKFMMSRVVTISKIAFEEASSMLKLMKAWSLMLGDFISLHTTGDTEPDVRYLVVDAQ